MARYNPSVDHVCATCGQTHKPAAKKEGDVSLELLLLAMALINLFFNQPGLLLTLAGFFPALLYSAWRHTTPAYVCPHCGGNHLVES